MIAVFATSTWYCDALRALAAAFVRAADRLDEARSSDGSIRRHEAEEQLVAARDRILSRYY